LRYLAAFFLSFAALVVAVPTSAGVLNIVPEDEPRSVSNPGFVRVHRNAASPAEGDIVKAISSTVDADYLERFPRADFMLVAHVSVSEAEAAEGESNRFLSISCGVARRSGFSPVLAEGYRPEFLVAVVGGDLAKDASFTSKSVARVCRAAQRKAVSQLHN
jgi:hypothetical protein